MSLVPVARTESDARRHVMKIRLTAGVVRENLPKLVAMIQEAQQFRDDQILGYASWTAYVADVFSDEPLHLPREERQELVAILAGEGMSTRAIAPIVGVDQKTVVRDIQREANASPALTDEPGRVTKLTGSGSVSVNVTPTLPPREDDWIPADPQTGEVIEPTVTEHTVTEKTKVTIGLDGKQYHKPLRLPPLPPIEKSVEQLNAEQAAHDFGHSVMSLMRVESSTGRRVVLNAWARAADACSPATRDFVTAEHFREIARGLDILADEWEQA